MIDWQRVSTLRDEIGADDFDEVVPMFLDEVEEITDQLRAQPDVAKLGDQLHFLKGSAVSLGFATFSAMCSEGETKAAGGDGALVDVAAILDCYEQSKKTFMAGLSNGLAA